LEKKLMSNKGGTLGWGRREGKKVSTAGTRFHSTLPFKNEREQESVGGIGKGKKRFPKIAQRK